MAYVQLCKSGIKVCQPVSATVLPIQAIFCFYCCTSINQACEKEESQHSSLQVCLSHFLPPSPWQPPAPPSWKGLCSAFRRQTVCILFRTRLSFALVHFGKRKSGLYLESLILFSHLVYKCIAPLALFLMMFNLWRDPGP